MNVVEQGEVLKLEERFVERWHVLLPLTCNKWKETADESIKQFARHIQHNGGCVESKQDTADELKSRRNWGGLFPKGEGSLIHGGRLKSKLNWGGLFPKGQRGLYRSADESIEAELRWSLSKWTEGYLQHGGWIKIEARKDQHGD